MMILPVAGTLIGAGALVAVIGDSLRSGRGTFEVAGGVGSGDGGQDAPPAASHRMSPDRPRRDPE